ncbi:acetyl-CoA hydrolase/transferase family protein [Ramlibacter sp. AN1133]|uniref:acetyl-CoA hydrolase/transferase family protein n=1 Tax=Ramlibacter sp. AN1133 TaxID=3133429 RepID=UPI0030BD9B4B
MKELALADLRFAGIVRPGDTVVWGQAASEPFALTAALMAQRHEIGRFAAFIGVSWSDAVQPAFADAVRFLSYCGGGRNRALVQAGALDILPCHYSELGTLMRRGQLPVDVVLVQVAPADEQGRFSLSLAGDYVVPALAQARVVVAEINAQAPRTHGPHFLTAAQVHFGVHTDRPPLAPPPAKGHPAEAAVARNVAALVEDGMTIQTGIGSLPDAIALQLTDRRDLGFHSGSMGDGVAALIRAGVITNARKTIDAGVSVAGCLMGSSSLNTLADCNPALQVRSVDYTHAPQVLASIDRLVTINAAIEVDLTGQVNAEVAGGVYVGAVGGAVDFVRGARASRGGMPIIALPSRTGGKSETSRIVARLHGPVSTARGDAVVVVTEHGVADLRGLTLAQRVQEMLAIAHPEERERLAREAHSTLPVRA